MYTITYTHYWWAVDRLDGVNGTETLRFDNDDDAEDFVVALMRNPKIYSFTVEMDGGV